MARFSQTKIRGLLSRGDNANTTTEKGRALEDLICYLFSKITGIAVTGRNENNVFHSEEIDVAFWNEKNRNALDFLPNLLFVECKNWSVPIGSAEVREFESKLRGKGLTFGVIVAANGITGDEADRIGAHHVIDRALAEQRQIIVITREEIEALVDTNQLIGAIKQKLCRLYVAGSII